MLTEQRVDTYLLLPGNDILGIKIRHQLLEIKMRTAEIGAVALHSDVTGNVEEWHKWSFGLHSTGEYLTARVDGSGHWLEVQKRRRMVLFSIDSPGQMRSLIQGQSNHSGCAVEVTELQVGGQDWWSLSFEAFGVAALLQQYLIQTATQVFAVGDPPVLHESYSYGYPKWLGIVCSC